MFSTGTGPMPVEYVETATGQKITVGDCLKRIADLERENNFLTGHKLELCKELAERADRIHDLERELAESKNLYRIVSQAYDDIDRQLAEAVPWETMRGVCRYFIGSTCREILNIKRQCTKQNCPLLKEKP